MANNQTGVIILIAGALLLFNKQVGATIGGVGEGLTDISQGLGTAVTGLGSGISEGGMGLGSGISTAGIGVGSGISDVAEDITNVTSNVSHITDPIGTLGKGTSNLLDNAFRNIQDPQSKFRQNLSSIGSKLNPFGSFGSNDSDLPISTINTPIKKSSRNATKPLKQYDYNPFVGSLNQYVINAKSGVSSAYNPDGSFKEAPASPDAKAVTRILKKKSNQTKTNTPSIKKETNLQRMNRETRARWNL